MVGEVGCARCRYCFRRAGGAVAFVCQVIPERQPRERASVCAPSALRPNLPGCFAREALRCSRMRMASLQPGGSACINVRPAIRD